MLFYPTDFVEKITFNSNVLVLFESLLNFYNCLVFA